LAWTVIYGLIIATFLTLIIVPLLYYIVYRIKLYFRGAAATDSNQEATTITDDEELADALNTNILDNESFDYPIPEGE